MLFVAIHNLLFNWAGFEQHVRFLIGGGSRGYQMFARTVAGEIHLARFTLDLVRVAWGWPLFRREISPPPPISAPEQGNAPG